MRLNIETIERSEHHYIAVACPEGSLWSEAGVGGADSEQVAAVQAVNSYFSRKRDKEAAKEALVVRPVQYGSACFVSDVDPTTQGYVSKEQTANALEFGDPHAGHPIGEPAEKRAPFHPLSTPVSYSKIVAVTPKQIGLLLRNAEGTDKVVLITGTKVTGERYVRRHVRVREVVDLPDDDTVAHVTDVAADAPRSFRLSGIERAEQA